MIRRSGRERWPIASIGQPALVLVALAVFSTLLSRQAAAAPRSWSEAFAGVSDTVLFIGEGQALWKAPFDLATSETLWTASGRQRMARLRVSPDRASAAWLSRADDVDTTRLWAWHHGHTRQIGRYYSFRPSRYRSPLYEPVIPSGSDAIVRGARLVKSNAMMLRTSSNALAWTPHSDLVVFGFDGGIAAVDPDSLAVHDVSQLLVNDVVLLDPAPVLIAEVNGPANPELEAGSYLVYPAHDRWRMFRGGGLSAPGPWCSDGTTIWFGDGHLVRAVEAYDPTPKTVHDAGSPVKWIECDAGASRLAWVAGNRVYAKSGEGPPRVTLATESPIEAVIAAPESRVRGLVTKDSLVIWDSGRGEALAVPLEGLVPTALFSGAGGETRVAVERTSKPAELWRVDADARRLVSVPVPKVKGGRLAIAPGGTKLILFAPGARPPETVHVLDLSGGEWIEVDNPGVGGWEILSAGEGGG